MPRLPRRVRHGDNLSFVEHLEELRLRLIVSLVAVAVALVATYAFRKTLIGWLNAPLPEQTEPVTLSPVEPFMTSLTVAVYAALALALPVLLWQLWSFLAPAFEEASQTVVARLVVAGSLLFAVGMAFAYWVVLPNAMPFLLGFDSELYDIQLRAREYYSFAATTIFLVGLLFELPMFVLAFVRLGILTSARLRANRRIGYGLCIIAAVLLPGVDFLTMALQILPVVALFEGSIWLAVLFERRWAAAGVLPGGALPRPTKPSATDFPLTLPWMARASTTQRRRRPEPPARRPAPSAEDLMFFPKLRKRAKWVFLALAIMFALSVVFFGVGTGISGANPIDAILGVFEERRAAGGGPSVDEAQEQVTENPKDAKARLELANALQADGRTQDAIAQLEIYTEMKRRDTNALQQLAALYDAQASEAQDKAIEAQLEAQRHLFPESFAPPEQSRIREEIGGGAIAETVSARSTERASAAYQEMQAAYTKEAGVYRKLTALVPDDPLLHLQLGQASQFAGDTKGAITAYKRFLALAPDDPNAPLVRQELRRLQPKPGKG